MTIPALVADFREGLARGVLLMQKCNACGRCNMYPRYACPYCQSEALVWQPASGKATLLSYTVLRMGAPAGFEQDLPYGLGVVRLEEGVQLLARLLPDADGNWQSYRCDEPLIFTPATAQHIEQRPCAWFGHAQP